jgi:hypothetical protein
VLAGQRILHGLRAEQPDALAATASEVMFPAGQRIFADGGYVGSFWLIESGYVDLDVQVPGESPEVIGTAAGHQGQADRQVRGMSRTESPLPHEVRDVAEWLDEWPRREWPTGH